MEINIETTSLDSGFGEDIILRETKTTRLIFRPQIVNNIHDENASIKGSFKFQKKRLNDSWEDYREFDTNRLKAEEWIKLSISTSETLRFFQELSKYYKLHDEYGIRQGSYRFYETSSEIESVISLFDGNKELFYQLLEEDKGNLLEQTLEWIAQADNAHKAIEQLETLREYELDQLNTLIGLTKLKNVLSFWKDNQEEPSESFWQEFLKEHTWILSQIFSIPTVLIQDEAYVGGKSIDNKSGKLVDFLYANSISRDAVLIEIKTPKTQLISNTEYRNGVYPAHTDLVGAVSQVLTYKDSITKSYSTMMLQNFQAGKESNYEVINPDCVVIAGKMDSLESTEQKLSFELYRKELKNVTIITFDELFLRVKNLIEILES